MMLSLSRCSSLVVVVILVALIGCKEDKYPGYSSAGEGLFYHLYSFGDGKSVSPSKGDFLKMKLSFYKGDTLIGSDLFKDEDGFDTLCVKDIQYDPMSSALSMLEEGDSASFIFEGQSPFNLNDTLVPAELRTGKFRMEAKLVNIKPEKLVKKERLLHSLWVKEKRVEELQLLSKFIEGNNINAKPDSDHFYFIPLQEGTGDLPKTNQAATIQYSASYLSGKEFYSTIATGVSLEFIVGAPGQVLPGMDRGIRKMREGGKARFIVPSHLAFGERGSSTGLVGPFRTLIFDVELVKLK